MIEFVTDGHQDRFMHAWSMTGYPKLPADWAAALYVLTADVYLWPRIAKHIDFPGRRISFNKIVKTPTGHGEACMLQLAWALFNGAGKLNLYVLINSVDGNNFTVAMRAMRVLYHGSESLKLTA